MFSVLDLQQKYSNEKTLIILISRLYFKTEQKQVVVDFLKNEPIDWDLFYKICAAHSLRAFLFYSIKNEDLALPGAIIEKIKKHAVFISINSLHQMGVLAKLLKEFETIKETVIPYKGVTFAASYYDNLALRESTDIDLLVPINSVQKLRTYFHEQKYVAKTDVPNRYLTHFIKYFKEVTFKTPKDSLQVNCTVELQWRLLGKFVGDFENYEFFAPHLQDFNFKGLALKNLSPTYDLICIASNHLVKEPLFSFKYLIDLASIVHKSGAEIDVATVEKTMHKFGYNQIFLAGMGVCNDLLGINLEEWESAKVKNDFLLESVIAYPSLKGEQKLSFKVIKTLNNYDLSFWRRFKRKCVIIKYFFLPSIEDLNGVNAAKYSVLFLFITRPFRLLNKALYSK